MEVSVLINIIRYVWLFLSGSVVLLYSLWMTCPEFWETDSPTYRWYYLLLFVIWVIGVTLQMKDRTRMLGISITLIPIVPITFLLMLFVLSKIL